MSWLLTATKSSLECEQGSEQRLSAPQQEPNKRTKHNNKVKPIVSLNFHKKPKKVSVEYACALGDTISYLQLKLKESGRDESNRGSELADLPKAIDTLFEHSPYRDHPDMLRIKHFMDLKLVTNTRDFIKMSEILSILNSFQEDIQIEGEKPKPLVPE